MTTGVCCMKCGGDVLVGPALCAGCAPELVAERDALLAALRKCRAHTSYNAGADRELLTGLLASIDRICDAALAAQTLTGTSAPAAGADS